jgi:hypothetical protein
MQRSKKWRTQSNDSSVEVSQKSKEWQKQSYAYLKAEIAQIAFQMKTQLYNIYGQGPNPEDSLPGPSAAIEREIPRDALPPLALDRLVECFNLNAQERKLLVFCAGWEIDETFIEQYGLVEKEFICDHPSLRLLQKLIPDFTDDLLYPYRVLQKFRLIEVSPPHDLLPHSPLKIDVSVLQYLLGFTHDTYAPLTNRSRFTPKPFSNTLEVIPDSYRKSAEQLHTLWTDEHPQPLATVQLCGPDLDANHYVAALTCDKLNQSLYRVDLKPFSIPEDFTLFHDWLIWWHRRALLQEDVLLIHCGNPAALNPHQEFQLAEIIRTVKTPLILSSS